MKVKCHCQVICLNHINQDLKRYWSLAVLAVEWHLFSEE